MLCMVSLQQCPVHFSTNVSEHFQTEWEEICWRGIRISGPELHVFAAEGVLTVSLLRQMQKSVVTTNKKLSKIWLHFNLR